MQKIELNKLKNSSLWHWRYALIFSVYALASLLVFISVSKFLAKEINRSFGQASPETESVTTSLDLAAYQRLAGKLKLATSTPDTENASNTPPAIITTPANDAAPTSTAAASTTHSDISAQPDRQPIIMIANSTKKAGLAGKLKASLSSVVAADYKTGNLPPPLKQTIIRYKDSLDPGLIESIKQAVSARYDPLTEAAAVTSAYDIEIIIGER